MYELNKETLDLFRNIASVGKAINDTYSEENLDTGTDFYMALDSLNKVKEGVAKFALDEPTRVGMNELIEYLHKKIERRLGYTGAKT